MAFIFQKSHFNMSNELNNRIDCSFCNGRFQCSQLVVLDDELFNLVRTFQDCSRNALFCVVCVGRMDNKLNRRNEREQRRQRIFARTGDTDTSEDDYDVTDISSRN